MASATQNRFEPVPAKKDRSATKRIALFIFIAAGALFILVAMAIVNSGDELASSRAPSEVIEASRGASSVLLPPPPRETEPEPEPRQDAVAALADEPAQLDRKSVV